MKLFFARIIVSATLLAIGGLIGLALVTSADARIAFGVLAGCFVIAWAFVTVVDDSR
jgi:hypothetical protein